MKRLKTIRVHAEEKGHWIVAIGYAISATFFSGHNATLTAFAYGFAALLATHADHRVRTIRESRDGDN